MKNKIVEWIQNQEIKRDSPSKNKELSLSMRNLVTILFAVVFSVGLNLFLKVKDWHDLLILVVAYIAIILSWLGYHMGTIEGPSETNRLNYYIDCLLVVSYWVLINFRSPLGLVFLVYTGVYLMYCCWEVVRYFGCTIDSVSRETVRSACKCNFIYFIIFAFCSFNAFIFENQTNQTLNVWLKGSAVLLLLILLIRYRCVINDIYCKKGRQMTGFYGKKGEKLIIDKAREVSRNARIHLSGFAVGAAILSDKNNIYVGCNVEFDNYSNTIHAEESAIAAFVSAGEKKAVAIAVVTFTDDINFPCGMCRQSLYELGGEDLKVIACNEEKSEIKTIGELLPRGFKLKG